MQRVLYGVVLLMLSIGPTAAASAINWTDCENDDNAHAVVGCSEIIGQRGLGKKDLSRAYRTRGFAHSKNGNLDEAIADYNEAIRLNPKDEVAYNNRAIAYSDKGDYDAAITDLNTAIRLQPNTARPFSNRANVHFRKKDYDRAIGDASDAIRLDPDLAIAYVNRADALRAKGENDRATADLTEAIRLNPEFSYAFNVRGQVYLAKSDYDHAIADYSEAILLDAENVSLYRNRGNAYYQKGEYDQAIADYNEAFRLAPKDAGILNRRGVAYYAKGNYDRAISDFSDAISIINPQEAAIYTNRGDAYRRKGENDRAISDLSEALRLDPTYFRALRIRGIAHREKGGFDRAIADLSEAIRLDPQDAGGHVSRGTAYQKKGEHDQAIIDFSETIRLDPKDATAHKSRADSYKAKGEHDLANADITEGNRLDEVLRSERARRADLAKARAMPKLEIVPIIPHSSGITSLAFSPDGARLISGSRDRTAKLWDAATGRLLRTFDAGSGQISSVVFSSDGTRILSVGGAGEVWVSGRGVRLQWRAESKAGGIKLWDAATGRLLRIFKLNATRIASIAISLDGARLLSAGGGAMYASASAGAYYDVVGVGSGGAGPSDNGLAMSLVGTDPAQDKVTLWDLVTGRPILVFEDTRGVNSVAFSPDGTCVLTGGGGYPARGGAASMRLWDAATGKLILTFDGHPDGVHSVAFSRDGRLALSGGSDKTVKLWDVTTGKLLRTFEALESIGSVVFSPATDYVIAAGVKTVLLWDMASGKRLHTYYSTNPLDALALSPDGKRLATGTADGTIRVWDVATEQLIPIFGEGSAPVFAVSTHGNEVVSASGDNTLKLWDVSTGQLARRFADSNPIRSVAFSRDGTRVLSGGYDKKVKLWDTATGQELQTFDGHSGGINSVALSPDNTMALSGSWDETATLWDMVGNRPRRTFKTPSDVVSVAISPDGGKLLAGIADKTTRLWDTVTGKLVRTFKEDSSWGPLSVAFSPDGKQVLSGGWGTSIRMWDAASGNLLRALRGHSSLVGSVAFSSDGAKVLSGSQDKTVKLWDAATGELLRTLEGHLAEVRSVAFSRDGTRAISASEDTTIKIWDLEAGQVLVTFMAGRDGEWLAITPEGFFAASPKGAEMLTVVRGLDAYSIDQVYQTLYRPDLVREKLAGDPDGKVKEAAKKLDLAKVLDSGPVPKVTISSEGAGSSSATDLVTFEAAFDDQGGGIGRVEWRINGITIKVQQDVHAGVLKQDIALDPGENTIEVVAYNSSNLVASVPARTKVVWTGTEPSAPPRLHVLALGINDYWDGKLKLTYAVPDAKSFAEALKEAGKGLYEDVGVTLVLDRDGTAQHLDQLFAELAQKIRPRDVFVFYAAGHGVTQDGRYYFIPQDFKYETDETYAKRAIGQERLQAWLAKIAAKKSIVIFDTCESGTLTGVQLASLRGGFEQLAAVGRLIQATGRTTLTAALDNQPALEGYRGHGVFTFAMLDALARGDRNANGLIEVTELIDHVDGLVPEITVTTWGTRQVPRSLFQGTNFALARQLPALAPAPGEPMIISRSPTHVVTELVKVFGLNSSESAVVRTLQPFTTVTLVKTDQGWALVAKDGQQLGFVAVEMLKKLQ